MTDTEPDLLREVEGGIALVTLNRPHTLNALTGSQFVTLHAWLSEWADDPAVRAVVMRGAGGKALSAGGDIRAVHDRRGDEAFMREVYRVEYRVNRLIKRYPKPYVALMDGIVMGGGCGVSVHGSHRIVTETTVFAMPETAIGLFCDIAGGHFLSRAPGHVGEYLGLTGRRINAADSIWCGFADHFMPRERLPAFIDGLKTGVAVNEAIARFAKEAGPSPLSGEQARIDRCFGAESVPAILAALQEEGSEWAEETRATLLRLCPFSLVTTLRLIREGRHKTLEECLVTDYRVALRFMERDDYFEGVRARLVDRGTEPQWHPARLEDVDPAEIDHCFSPLPQGDLEF